MVGPSTLPRFRARNCRLANEIASPAVRPAATPDNFRKVRLLIFSDTQTASPSAVRLMLMRSGGLTRSRRDLRSALSPDGRHEPTRALPPNTVPHRNRFTSRAGVAASAQGPRRPGTETVHQQLADLADQVAGVNEESIRQQARLAQHDDRLAAQQQHIDGLGTSVEEVERQVARLGQTNVLVGEFLRSAGFALDPAATGRTVPR